MLQDARVPAENVLGEVGKGHKVAFNVLELRPLQARGDVQRRRQDGRSARRRLRGAAPAVRPADRARSARSGTSWPRWRFASTPSRRCCTAPPASSTGCFKAARPSADMLAALEEFAVEASILKVAASEMLDFVARRERADSRRQRLRPRLPGRTALPRRAGQPDLRGHQRDQPAARPGMLARRAVKGTLPLIAAARTLQDELLTPSLPELRGDRIDVPLDDERRAVAAMKKVALMVLGTAMQTYGEKLADQQEVLSAAADIIIDVYAAESVVLRGLRGSAGAPFEGSQAATRRSRIGVRQRRRRSASRSPPAGTGGDGRRRHAADTARGAAPLPQGGAGQHRRAAPPRRGCGRRAEGLSFLGAVPGPPARRRPCRPARRSPSSPTIRRSRPGTPRRMPSCVRPTSLPCRRTSAPRFHR